MGLQSVHTRMPCPAILFQNLFLKKIIVVDLSYNNIVKYIFPHKLLNDQQPIMDDSRDLQ